MYDELWSEIQDSSGEIFDISYLEEHIGREPKEKKFDFNEYLNSNIDY